MAFNEYQVAAVGTLVRRVFGWMTLGLTVTGLTAFAIDAIPNVMNMLKANPSVVFILMLAQLGLVIYLNVGLQRMSRETAVFSYLLYSALTGITLSTLFLLFTKESLALTFLICAATFAVMGVYGLITKADLSGLGSFLFMGLIGLIIAGFINIFLGSAQFEFITSIFGVIIFTLFVAYDVQMVKRMGLVMFNAGGDMTKVSIICALKLYLDFVNLFLYLLRFFGQRKN